VLRARKLKVPEEKNVRLKRLLASQRPSKAHWDETVDDMIARGAQVA
jgi:malonyl CoA-acyl carrier protein transacylase